MKKLDVEDNAVRLLLVAVGESIERKKNSILRAKSDEYKKICGAEIVKLQVIQERLIRIYGG